MTRVAMSATAALLKAAAEQQRSAPRWPDPTTALACCILERAGHSRPAFVVEHVTLPSEATLRLTPELATYGFLLGSASKTDNANWLAAIDHLRGRVIYPPDRQSFIFNPIEVIGVALGLSQFEVGESHRTWFVDVLRRGFSGKHFLTPASSVGALAALTILDRDSSKTLALSPIDLSSLSLAELLLILGIDLAFPGYSAISREALETELLNRALTREIAANDPAEAATLYVVALRIKDQLLVPKSLIDGLEKVTIICRRFPLFADTLRSRQQKRVPFGISDEYDVQDLLHAILRLHFDDVRPEENTPSYAGNHSRVDFLLPKERILIEAKMTRKGLPQKEVVNQLLIDVARYSKFSGIETLVCLIYDPDRHCTNPRAIENDIEESGHRLKVRVIVCPQII